MKLSSIFMAIAYFIMGILFSILALNNLNHSGWNFIAIAFTLLAAFDFGVGYRYLRHHLSLK